MRDSRLRLVFLGCMALGIGLMGWAAVNILAQPGSSTDGDRAYTPGLAAIETTRASSVVSTSSEPASKSAESTNRSGTSQRKIVYKKHPKKGQTLGILSLPSLGQMLPIIEGTRDGDLKKGVGHFSKSVMPGQTDNCVLSAHRDTYFARLGELKKGDKVTVETAAGSYTYKVDRIRIVGKNDKTVIVPTKHGVLTLSTCYPFNYVGSAPRRYIVSARLIQGE